MNLIPDPLRPYLTLIKAGVVVLALAAAFIGGCSHERDHWTQKWADRDAGDKAIADAAAVKAKADKLAAEAAEAKREQELKDLRKYRDDHPVGPVRLCVARPAGVPTAPSPLEGHGGPSTVPGPVQSVPAGDSPSGATGEAAGPDVSGMLDALAARADYVSAGLREWQRR